MPGEGTEGKEVTVAFWKGHQDEIRFASECQFYTF